MPDNDEVRKSIAYHGSVPGKNIMLEKDGEDLIPEYDDNGMFVIDPRDGEKTYIIWA
jgi:hypothetical protein